MSSKLKVPSKTGAKAKPAKAPPAQKMKKPTEFAVPPFSVTLKQHEPIDFAKLKAKTVRRQAPEGENKKELARIIKSLNKKKVMVEEYINLVTPFTGDQGECFRSVTAEELDSFRKLARKIYETMSSDVSDVLVNEHVQITAFYEERRQLSHEKMMKMITEIHEIAPEFDFGKYMVGRQEYLNIVLPIPHEVNKSDEEVEMHRRQQAYHRLQWLRMEGERLGEENRRLKDKLGELKAEQKEEVERMERAKEEGEAKKHELEEMEAQAKDKLDKLNESVEKSMIENEALLREQEDDMVQKMKERPRKTAASKKKKKQVQRPPWVSEAAHEMEAQSALDAIQTEASDAANRRLRLERGKREPPAAPAMPPDQGAGAEGSCPAGVCGPPPRPFQFGPPEPPYQPAQVLETNVHQMTATVQQQRQQQQQHQQLQQQMRQQGLQRMGRPGCAPRDTWGGFY